MGFAIIKEQHAEARPIRVCFMVDRLARAGTESQLLALIQNLDRARIQPFLCLLDGEDMTSRALAPASCRALPLGVRSLHHPGTITKLVRLIRFLRGEQIDVLQVYFPDSTYLGVLAARLAGVPYVIRTRNNLGHWLTPAHRWLGRLCNVPVTGTIANCEACRQALLEQEKPRPESVIVLENGVDLDRFLGVRPLRPDIEHYRIGIVANLRPVKGLDDLIDAATRIRDAHPAVHIRVAGEGELRPHLEQRAREQRLVGRLQLVGAVTDVPSFLADVDIAVLTSHAEGMSNAVLEYMAAGRAIVATAVGANVQLLEDGVHGLLVPARDPATLARAIDRLLRDPALGARLGAAARQRVRERYSLPAMVARFENFYERLIREGRMPTTGPEYEDQPRRSHEVEVAA
jgi:glycosyltransferase involved in cell wall biosynthesis